ncbi:tyrosine-protein kinase STK-like [Patiria miniata]|uniref:non-specific protein-tyrosine kinase n=1 Tax=Patiria miniata TaxID=46514 RepID=A0A914B613_PATMI|nr:tyrosine-protein kinase STK-like [Patiria miniata]
MFIVRDSESKLGSFALSVRNDNRVIHYKITVVNHKFKIDTECNNQREFECLYDLLRHYRGDAGGLNLSDPCPKETQKTMGLDKDDWESPREALTLGEKLSVGRFGEVFKGTWLGKTPVAIKTFKEGTMIVNDFLAEANVMKKLRHPKLCQLFAVCTEMEPIYIVMEFMCNGSLLVYLRDGEGRDLKLPELVKIGAQIASGMAYMEFMKFVHCDVAARNVLVGEGNIVKVSDFGLARMIEKTEYTAKKGTVVFPVKWTAPETFMYGRVSTKSDVWSFGVLLTELVTHGCIPYPGMSNKDVMDKIQHGYRMPKMADCPQTLYKLMLKCWEKDPAARHTFQFLCSYLDHCFVSTEPDCLEVEYNLC